MEDAALIDQIDKPGVLEIHSAERSTFSSASHSPSREPAGNNSSGSGGQKAARASGEPVRAMGSGSRPATAPTTTDEARVFSLRF